MRQRLGAKKVKRIAETTGLDVVHVLVRGGTGHRKDLCLRDGSVVHLFQDGTTEKSDMQHALPIEEPEE